jgi:hypothetical protein
MGGISEEAIRERAYDIWEREGRPAGRDFDHWVQAQVELAAEVTKGNGGKSSAPRAAAAKAPPAKARPAPARAGRNKKS